MTPPKKNFQNNGNPLYERSFTGRIVTACIVVAVIFAIYMMSGRNNIQPAANLPVPTTTGSTMPVPAPSGAGIVQPNNPPSSVPATPAR